MKYPRIQMRKGLTRLEGSRRWLLERTLTDERSLSNTAPRPRTVGEGPMVKDLACTPRSLDLTCKLVLLNCGKGPAIENSSLLWMTLRIPPALPADRRADHTWSTALDGTKAISAGVQHGPWSH